MTDIRLTIGELHRAGSYGYTRWCRVVARKLAAEYDEDNGDPSNHIIGAWGECVVARMVDGYWPTDNGPDRHSPDVSGLHVRTGRRPTDRLVLHHRDPDDGVYVLVVVVAVPMFRVAGGIAGADAKRPEWWRTEGVRHPAYFVPQSALRPIDELTLSSPGTGRRAQSHRQPAAPEPGDATGHYPQAVTR